MNKPAAIPLSSADPIATDAVMPVFDESQIRSLSREEKDRFWLTHIYRGDMPQLTLRAAVTGFVLGGLLSATNLYVGAKTGWTLGVGLTSVILAFSAFKLLGRIGVRDMTILENNASQSIATAAGYMTAPLVSGLAAFMWVENRPLSWPHMLVFNVVLSVLGVLVAFPMKRRFINDEQHPFPEGRACGVVLDTLYRSHAATGLFKAKALAVSSAIAAFIGFISGPAYMKLIQERWLGLASSWHLPESLDEWYYRLAEKGVMPIPRIAGIDIRQLGLSPTLDVAMIGTGALIGMRTATSMLVGMLVNFVVIVPWMITLGEIAPKSGSLADGTAVFGRAHVVNHWALWWGIAIMVVSSMVGLLARPEVFVQALRSIRRKAPAGTDALAAIELPLWVSWVGVPIVGAVSVVLGHAWFGVPYLFGAAALPLIVILTLIAATSTAMTSITPTGALSKIPQFLFGSMDAGRAATNLMTGVMCTEVALNASNLLMDIKPGYMLGAKPRQQAVAHLIGIAAGALASTPLFYALFLADYSPGQNLQNAMAPDGGQFGFPSAMQWKGVSDLVTAVFGGGHGSMLSHSMIVSMAVAAIVGAVLEIGRDRKPERFMLSPLAIGLGVVVPPESTMAMFAGALLFFWMGRRYAKKPDTRGHLLWVQTLDPICAGLIAGAALVGIGDVLVRVFVL